MLKYLHAYMSKYQPVKMLKCSNVKIKEKGVAIYLAVIVMFVLLGIGLGLTTLLVGQIRTIARIGDSVTAFYAADTGIERELHEDNPIGTTYSGFLDINGNGTTPSGACPDALVDPDSDDACYRVTVVGEDIIITTVDNTGSVGRYNSIAIGADGFPVISYYDQSNDDLKVVKCGDAACTVAGNTITTVDSTGSVGEYTSIAIGADGFPVISYYDQSNRDLKVLNV